MDVIGRDGTAAFHRHNAGVSAFADALLGVRVAVVEVLGMLARTCAAWGSEYGTGSTVRAAWFPT